jgi:hypothetical protein
MNLQFPTLIHSRHALFMDIQQQQSWQQVERHYCINTPVYSKFDTMPALVMRKHYRPLAHIMSPLLDGRTESNIISAPCRCTRIHVLYCALSQTVRAAVSEYYYACDYRSQSVKTMLVRSGIHMIPEGTFIYLYSFELLALQGVVLLMTSCRHIFCRRMQVEHAQHQDFQYV